MHRRDALKALSGLALANALPLARPAFAAPVSTLPIPPLLAPEPGGRIRLTLGQGQSRWLSKAATPTWGINGPVLGPALALRRGQDVTLVVENGLPEATAIHWHGLEIPGESDGGPQAIIDAGKSWSPRVCIDQPAATCWFHPHPHGKTGRHVAMGLGGLIVIEDDDSRALPLPRRWGVDDVPLILQDKRLDASGRIDYAVDEVSAAVGWFGDMLLVNGSVNPQHTAPRGWLRLRLLNGSNARTFRIGAGDKRDLFVIAGDGGFLSAPVKLRELTLLPGERFEVMVDLSNGKDLKLVSLPVQQMGMTLKPFDKALPVLHVRTSGERSDARLPDRLTTLPPLPSVQGLPPRTFQLSMDPRLDERGMAALMQRYGHQAMAGMPMHGQTSSVPSGHAGMDHAAMGHGSMDHGAMGHGMSSSEKPFDLLHANFINAAAFTMGKPAFDVRRGQYERWIITGEGDMMLHPFHIHGAQFRILSENGKAPAAHRAGRKDIVWVEGGRSEVLVRFDHAAPAERAYMAHCHVLEHEDTGMMTSFTVSA